MGINQNLIKLTKLWGKGPKFRLAAQKQLGGSTEEKVLTRAARLKGWLACTVWMANGSRRDGSYRIWLRQMTRLGQIAEEDATRTHTHTTQMVTRLEVAQVYDNGATT